ncbi:MAG: hypothetical protein QOH93_1051, partial [Chloroflexia bacterium]|nr:hypothetical protein [Chloroflexia bacterium]
VPWSFLYQLNPHLLSRTLRSLRICGFIVNKISKTIDKAWTVPYYVGVGAAVL